MLTEEQIKEAGEKFKNLHLNYQEGENEVDPTEKEKEEYTGSQLSEMAANLEENKKKALELMEDLSKQGHTAINSNSLKDMREVLGEDVIEEIWKNKTSMLPEHLDLINISNKSRAHTIAQLLIYAELMKAIQASNQVAQEKMLQSMMEQAEMVRQSVFADGKKVQDEIAKERKNLEAVILQSAKIQNEIAATQAKTLKLIEEKVDKFMEENMQALASTVSGKIANSVYKAKFKDIQLKSKIFFAVLGGMFLAIGMVIGKTF